MASKQDSYVVASSIAFHNNVRKCIEVNDSVIIFVWLLSFWLNIDNFKGNAITDSELYSAKHCSNAFAVLCKC